MGKDVCNVFEMTRIPVEVEGKLNIRFEEVQCGNAFSILLAETGDIYSAGSGDFGIHC